MCESKDLIQTFTPTHPPTRTTVTFATGTALSVILRSLRSEYIRKHLNFAGPKAPRCKATGFAEHREESRGDRTENMKVALKLSML